MFTGEYRHTVDDKGRLAVPARFRPDLAQGAQVSKWIDGCAALFPRADWDELAEKLAALPVSNEGSRSFQRFLFGAAFEIGLDRQGRFVLPAALRTYAGIETDVVVIGARNHLEFWAPKTWDQYSARIDQPDVLAEHIQGLGI
jgi:MraZ protein